MHIGGLDIRLNDGPDEKLFIPGLVSNACIGLDPLWLNVTFSLALTFCES